MKFASDEQPYLSFSRPMWVGRTYGDYDHLARVREWSATGGEWRIFRHEHASPESPSRPIVS